ncbi:MAG: hypothetical protein ACSHXJ_17345 [Marinomonas colpomeniae]
MKTIGYQTSSSIDLDKLITTGKDLLVNVHLTSVNPDSNQLRRVMFDDSGVLKAVGPDISQSSKKT